MYNDGYAGLKILVILRYSVSIIAILTLSSLSVRADSLLYLYKTTKYELNVVTAALSDVAFWEYNTSDDYGFTVKNTEVALVHLDYAMEPEIILRINDAASDGSAGEGFSILKKVAGKWTEIASDDFGEKHAIIVTDRVVNGFKVYRVLTDPYDRIYKGNGYTCPQCPP